MVRSGIMPRLIVVCGRQYAGKTTFAATLGGAAGFPVFEIGAFVFAEAEARGLSPHDYADEAFRRGDFKQFVHNALAAIPIGVGSAVLVGPRTVPEIEFLRNASAQSLCIGLIADRDERHRRWARSVPRKPHVATDDLWQAREHFEDRWAIDDALAICDVRIAGVNYGNGT